MVPNMMKDVLPLYEREISTASVRSQIHIISLGREFCFTLGNRNVKMNCAMAAMRGAADTRDGTKHFTKPNPEFKLARTLFLR